MAAPPLYELVRDLGVFRGLSEGEAQGVLPHARLHQAREGSHVYVQGAPAVRIFFLVSGRFKVVQSSSEGQQIIAHWVEPGQFFGFAGAFGLEDYFGTAVAVTDSVMLAWPMAAWPKIVALQPTLAEAALRTVGTHLQDMFSRLHDVGSARVEQRIARALLGLVRQSGRPTRQGVEVGFPITRQDVADMTTATLFTVSRTLSAWEQAGVLAGGRRRIEVLDLPALTRIAGEA